MSLITSENQVVCFPKIVLTVFWFSTTYTAIIVLWKMLMEPVNTPAHWWPCACLKCVSGLRRLEKPLNFLRCIHVIDLVLKYGSDINEVTGYSFFLASLYWLVWLPPLLEWVFFSCVSCFRLKFSRIALWRKRMQLDSKSDLTTNGLILRFFCWKMASFVDLMSVWTEICKNCSIVVLFWQHQFFSMFSLKGNVVCSLKLLVLFSHMIL